MRDMMKKQQSLRRRDDTGAGPGRILMGREEFRNGPSSLRI